MNRIRRIALFGLIAILLIALIGVGVLIVQAKQSPDRSARYVALGSSFAAGVGLGERVAHSPWVCGRTEKSYPQLLARLIGISLADMTCSGSTVRQVLHGGQFFQGSQIDAVGPNTELVTLTAGGNDIDYVGDLMKLSYRQRGGLVGHVSSWFLSGARSVENRPFAQLQSDMVATLREIAHRAPRARIIVVTYPAILPSTGTCTQIGIAQDDAALMRNVSIRLVEVTRKAAQEANVVLVDMNALSAGHDACGPIPWISGAAPEHGIAFHPTLAGAEATAEQIRLALNEKQ